MSAAVIGPDLPEGVGAIAAVVGGVTVASVVVLGVVIGQATLAIELYSLCKRICYCYNSHTLTNSYSDEWS